MMSGLRKVVTGALAAAVFGAVPHASVAGPLDAFSDFFVFGDSLSDPGNLFNDFLSGFTIPPGADPNGQVSDGDTWAAQLGADFNSGTNYAYAAARAQMNGPIPFSDGTNVAVVDVPDLSEQIFQFTQDLILGGGPADPNSIAAIMIGGNDLRDAISAPDPFAAAALAIQETVTAAGILLASGVGTVVVSGVPNLGLIPEVQALGASTVSQASFLSALYNTVLQTELQNNLGPGAVEYFDLFSLFSGVAASPGAFGFTEPLSNTCVDALLAMTALNCDGFLFFDSIHPTEAGHTIIANAFAEQFAPAIIPLPAGVVFLIGGLGALALVRRRT